MASKGFGIDFSGVNKLATELGNLGDEVLKQAVDNALTASKDYVNNSIREAMDASPYNFNKGVHYSRGKAKASLSKVSTMPVDWSGNIALAYLGVDLKEALEVMFLIWGTPHLEADTNLRNAIKVKGKYAAEVNKIQKEEFYKVLKGALNNG